MAEPYRVDQLPQVWQQRFTFFDAYGLPGSSSQSQAAFKALSFGKKLRLTTNLLAFFFGPVYYFVKGMWRKGLVLLAEAIAIGVLVAFNGPDHILSRVLVFAYAAVVMSTANYAYYLHAAKGSRSFNPFEGFSRRSSKA
ncbi:DUF2628 domain-containing protein [Mycobacterium sp.]|uniref:DUF2628 domain-containing protein n=1 Tax=Mycobacterium sp. TaxID=1785 RepID=UPI002D9C2837|nr:DUF2628 domain-containing protein [Mycobacterium sp.]